MTRRPGSIKPVAPGKWAVRCQVGVGLDGKRRTLSRTVIGNKREAEAVLADLVQQAGRGGAGQRLKDAATAWVNGRKRRVSAGSWERSEQLIRRAQVVVPALFAMKVTDIKASDINTALEIFTDRGRDMDRPNAKPAPLAPRTVLQLRGFLRQVFGVAVADKLISSNPVASSAPIPLDDAEARALTAEELAVVRDYFDRAASGYRALFYLLLGTGMRRGEAVALTWADVDLVAGTVVINKAVRRVAGRYVLMVPKTKKSKRHITLPAFATEALQAHHASLRGTLGLDILPPGLVVFGSPDDLGHFISPATVTSYFTAAFERLGIDAGSPVHCLRHTHATTLLGQISLASLAARLGHSKATTTLAIYAHAIKEMDDTAALVAEAAHTALHKSRTSNVVPMPQKGRGTRRSA